MSQMLVLPAVRSVIRRSMTVAITDPSIVFYPLLCFLVLLISIPALNLFILSIAARFLRISILDSQLNLPTGTIYFIAALTSLMLVSSLLLLMACVVSAATKAQLDGSKAPLIAGWENNIANNMKRIIKIGLLCTPITLIPMSILAQRKQLTRNPISVIISSITLGVGGIAPSVISTKGNITSTIRTTNDTLGKNWKVGLVIKVGLYAFLITLVLLSYIPTLLRNSSLNENASNTTGWIISVLIFVLFISALKIFSTIFTTILYYDAHK